MSESVWGDLMSTAIAVFIFNVGTCSDPERNPRGAPPATLVDIHNTNNTVANDNMMLGAHDTHFTAL